MRPKLEILEDRSPPASLAYSSLPPVQVSPAVPTIVDLDHFNPGTQITIVGNSNPALVLPSISDGELTLRYVPMQTGTATITIGVTNPDGSSFRETIQVSVLPGRQETSFVHNC